MDIPATRYARSADGTFIAFQVFGDGPNLLVAFPWISHLELFWEDPDVGRWLRSLARFARVITMDQRGIGLSDRMTQLIDLETKVDDVRAVLDAADSQRTTLYGQGLDGGAICSMFAAAYPERTAGLLLWSGEACGRSQPDYPWGTTEAEDAAFFDLIAETWGDQELVGTLMDEVGLSTISRDPVARKRWARTMRNAASRGDALIHERMFDETDYRGILPSIHVPTTILQREWTGASAGWRGVASAEWMASKIPGARLVQLPAEPDYPPYLGDTRSNLEAVEEFLSSIREEEAELDRVLATVMFTDIVDSTVKAVELGDRAWKDLVERHHTFVRGLLARHRGRELDTSGDGFFAAFDGPARAIRCACAIKDTIRPLGIEVRAGLHTGECELIDGKPGGVTVVIGARIGGLAQAGEVLVSQTVKDLVAGSGLTFESTGEHELKGLPDRWRLFRVVG